MTMMGLKLFTKEFKCGSMGKLVRDNIPTFIKSSGKTPVFHIEEDETKKYNYLLNKIVEEAKEVKNSTNEDDLLHEIADVYEVILSILKFKGHTFSDMQEIAKAKRTIRGSFDKFIILDRVKEKKVIEN